MTEPTRLTEPDIRPDTQAFLAYANVASGPKLEDLGAVEARRRVTANIGLIEADPVPLAVRRDVALPGPAGPIPARLYDSVEARLPGPMLVFFHGGGYLVGDLATHDALCTELAHGLGLPVVAIDYRLAPEHRWPAAPDDCEAAARRIAEGDAALGRRATGLVLVGDSAGGTMAVVTALALRDRPAAVPVLAQAPCYPAILRDETLPSFRDYAEGYFLSRAEMRWFGESYAADPGHWRASPGLAQLAGLPPALVLTAALDPLRDEGRNYAGALIAAGVPTIYREARGTIHGFLTMRRALPSGQGDLAAWLLALKALIAEAEANRVMTEAAR